MSHHSSAKPLVREVRQNLPRHVDAWVDEHEILPGDTLVDSIRSAIAADADFLVLFFDQRAAQSSWVQQELRWALEEERRVHRPFVIPILLEDDIDAEHGWIRERLYLRCQGYSESHVRHLAQELSSALFAWLSRDLDTLRASPARGAERLLFADRADALLQEAAALIRHIVFPFRRDRPMQLIDLLGRLRQESELDIASLEELHALLYRLRDRKMISGIALTGRTIFVGEEHLNWRSQESIEEKRAAAEYLVDEIDDDATIYLDAGSSTYALCQAICRGIKFRQWSRLEIHTIAVPIAALLSDLANELGMEDADPRLTVVVHGGHMRLNTSALVPLARQHPADIERTRFDVAFVGTNGVSREYGCTTTTPSEAEVKRLALLRADRRVILAEPSKYGVWQTERFANFDDGLEIVTACSQYEKRVHDLADGLSETSSHVTLIDMTANAANSLIVSEAFGVAGSIGDASQADH